MHEGECKNTSFEMCELAEKVQTLENSLYRHDKNSLYQKFHAAEGPVHGISKSSGLASAKSLYGHNLAKALKFH
jgi:hypothetical protein